MIAATAKRVLHDIRTIQNPLELHGAVEIGRFVLAAIDVPADVSVAVAGAYIVALRRPCNPVFAVRMREQRQVFAAVFYSIPSDGPVRDGSDDSFSVVRYAH